MTDDDLNQAQLAGRVSDNAITWDDVWEDDMIRAEHWLKVDRVMPDTDSLFLNVG